MTPRRLVMSLATAILLLAAGPYALAEEDAAPIERKVERPDVAAPGDAVGREPAPETIRGRELMTEEERERHRQEMRSKATAEEREQARREKHEEMKKRAREEGVELPDEPLPPGSGGGRGGVGAGGPPRGNQR